ncbi:Multidrug export protein EmrA [Marinomonas spartinae]|uniref:HlyD family efflux transporter periplasmic adaptor subunit n=1 Tax=Marinomonas spartinae TaxID=1792290 RepID=UPI000808C1D8|nr:HlyD family efflux transporter periplasmic adaptor subunit [Marinomonas spartinae]SBS39421.1 Multidrug export protein EmrA [Marinomonas spartinae]
MTDTEKHIMNKKTTVVALVITAVIACIAAYIWWSKIGQFHESTEDAYVAGNVVNVMSQVSGTVTDIMAENTNLVKQSDLLVKINPVDAKLALQQAQANLASTIRAVRNSFAALEEQKANVELAKVALDKADNDYQRRIKLRKNNLISNEDLSHYKSTYISAKASYDVAQKAYDAIKTKVDHTTVLTHPDVLKAESALKSAWLALHRTTIVAPVSGYVAQRSVQVGQHVSAGSTLMSIVPLNHVWVVANFKETQIGNIRSGQPVTLTSDVYGSSITYHGTVQGIVPGTGSAFSLLPASNATGNWIKVVQRVPVRIALQSTELTKHPLRPGLSMNVTVNTQNAGKAELTTVATPPTPWRTDVFDDGDKGANTLIQKIIKENI